jgi:adenylate cyclase
MKPEELLHLFGPYLPTDRFRALLCNMELPSSSEGAALLVDVVGFTPMTTRLVAELGPERACDELKRRLNPMFEAIAGQVFHHGGSVIHFTGDGFIAWFDDEPLNQDVPAGTGLPALLRALSAGLDMQSVMPLFRGLQLKVCIGIGTAHRWVVGQPQYGLNDVLSGPAVEAMASLGRETQPGQVLVHHDAIPWLRDEGINLELAETGSAVATSIPDTISKAARRHRWPAWSVESNLQDALNAVRPYVRSVIRERIESGFGDFVAELRQALPMFVRVSTVKAGADDARLMLDQYVCAVQDVLAETGGRLVSVEVTEKSSILFAVFGAPVTYGDDAERTIRAALHLKDLAVRTETVTAQRIGISRGLLYAGTIGGEVRREYSTIGDETNIAARLSAAARDGQILVAAAARDEAGDRIVFEDLLPLRVKGKTEPIPVAEPIAIQTGSQHQSYVGKFVGREAEIGRLRKFMAGVQTGFPKLVRLEGQAGIGKSRLVSELLASADGFLVASGDCVSTGRSTAYLPWRDIIVSLLGVETDGTVTPEESIARLSDLIWNLDPALLPRVPLLGDVLELSIPDTSMTATFEGRTRRQALFALVADLLVNLSHRQPLLLVLENAQWIDEVSEALTVDLAQRLSVDPSPIMLLLVHRPLSEIERPPEFIQALEQTPIQAHLLLDDLSQDNVTSMTGDYLRALAPPELSQFVHQRTHGNPLFVQEVLDTLLETGVVKTIGNIVFIDRDLQSADLPRTVQGLVLARLDRLDEVDKLILKVAAVIGREFEVRILAESLPIRMGGDKLLQYLRDLQKRDFCQLTASEPELVYAFKHAITQEVTYQSLLIDQRQQLHQAVAMVLETLAPDAVEQLAYHYARSRPSESALRYVMQAAQKAFDEHANQAALGYFSQALALTNDDTQRFEINSQRLQVILRLGSTQEILAEFTAMEEQAARAGRPDWQATVHLLWANYYTRTSVWPRVIDAAQKAIAFARQANADGLAWSAYRLLHRAFVGINQREEAEYITHLLQPLTDQLGDQRREIQFTLLQIEDLYTHAPAYSIKGAQALLEQAKTIGDPVLEIACWSALAKFYLRANDLPAALDASRQQIRLSRQVGDRRHEGLTLSQIGAILVKLGQLSEGNAHLLDGYKILRQIGERLGEATSFLYLGIIAHYYKAYDEALAYMHRGLAIQRELDADADAALTLFHMGNVSIAKGDLNEAEGVLREARALFEANSLSHEFEEVDAALAEIDLLRGDPEAAMRAVHPLLSRLQQRSMTDLIAPGLAYWRVIQVLQQCGQSEQAEQLRADFMLESDALLERLESPHWQERYIQSIWYHTALIGT